MNTKPSSCRHLSNLLSLLSCSILLQRDSDCSQQNGFRITEIDSGHCHVVGKPPHNSREDTAKRYSVGSFASFIQFVREQYDADSKCGFGGRRKRVRVRRRAINKTSKSKLSLRYLVLYCFVL